MALTITTIKRNRVGAQREVIADITFDNSYPTGGEALTAQDFDPSSAAVAPHYVTVHQKAGSSRLFSYDYANKKIMVFTAVGTEAANASDQSTIVVRALIRYGGTVG